MIADLLHVAGIVSALGLLLAVSDTVVRLLAGEDTPDEWDRERLDALARAARRREGRL